MMNNRRDATPPVLPESKYKSYDHQSRIRFLVNHCMELGLTKWEAEAFLEMRHGVSPNWTRQVWDTLMQESRPGQKRRRPIPSPSEEEDDVNSRRHPPRRY